MAFSAIIAHRIQRNTIGSPLITQLRPDIFPTTGVLEELAYELKTQFIRKGGKHYGRFSQDTAEFPFSAWLSEYCAERLGFNSFTTKIVEHFKSTLDHIDIYIDAYLFFTLEKIEAGNYLHIYLLEHISGLYLDGNMTLTESHYLDVSGFTLAAKINLEEWNSGDSTTYLTLMRTRGEKEISEAFTALLGFSDKHNIKGDTVEFLQAVENFANTLDDNTARVTRTKVVDYCLEQSKAGKPVIIEELSKNLSQEVKTYTPEHFIHHLEKTPEIKPEFISDASQLRNYVRISGRNDNLSMSFASECLGKEIVYDEANDILTIKNIPSALKARLLQHIKAT